MSEILRWYLTLTLIGGAGLLPAQLAFGRLRSRGLLFARPLALLLLAEGAWILSAVTPLQYDTPLAGALLCVLWAWSGYLAWARADLVAALRAGWRLLLAGEAVFAALFLVILFTATRAPAAILNEQPFDMLLLNVIRLTPHMPAPDPWLAGYDLAYYYLGQTMVDLVGRLAGLSPRLEYHLGFASAGAAAGLAIFALAGDVVALTRPRRAWTPSVAGALAVVLLLFASAPITIAALLRANDLATDFAEIVGVEWLPRLSAAWQGVPLERFWWARASVVIPGTLSEFPALTLVYGNLHAHWLALPLAVIAIAQALVTFVGVPSWRSWLREPGALFLAAALFAGLVMTNSWDGVTYGALWGLAATVGYARAQPARLTQLPRAALEAARFLALPALVAIAMALPYLRTVRTPLAIALLTEHTASPYTGSGWSDPMRFLLVWATLLLPIAAAAALLRPRVTRRGILAGAGLAVLPILLWVAIAVVMGEADSIIDRGSNWLTLTALVLAFGYASTAMWSARDDGDLALAACFGLIAAATAIIEVTEVLYFVDAMGGRTNTVFKFWYAAWTALAVASAVGIGVVADRGTTKARLLAASPLVAAGLTLVAASLLYVPAVTVSKVREGQRPGLDALAFLDTMFPWTASSAAWIRTHVRLEDGVVLEGASVTAFENRTSVATGMPTLMGWLQHEEIWRGTAPVIYERTAAVEALYRRGATGENLAWAHYFNIAYVVIGPEEEAQYGDGRRGSVAARFEGWPVVFERPDGRIIAIPR